MRRIDFASGKPVVASQTRGDDPQFAATHLTDSGYDTYWATDNDVLTGSVEIDLGRSCAFNVVEIQEYIPLGQRVKAWAVDAWIDGDWREIGAATTIGYKRLLRMSGTTTSKVRIRITSAKACPAINHVGLYQTPAIKAAPESSVNVEEDFHSLEDWSRSRKQEQESGGERGIDGVSFRPWETPSP